MALSGNQVGQMSLYGGIGSPIGDYSAKVEAVIASSIPASTFPTDPADGPQNTNTIDGISNYEICDRTGFKVPRGTLKREWTGAMVRPQSWEPRHPQDFVRARPESPKGSPRPEQTDTFIQDDEQIEASDL